MTTTSSNLRKAAVLIRSLDTDTAAAMLGQLSHEEATSIRAAIRELGPVDAEEQADVVAEFRRTRPAAGAAASKGVELELSSKAEGVEAQPATIEQLAPAAGRFQFLAGAPTNVIVRFLAREHAQTIAVVLSHLPPERAAEVLGELPEKLQSEAIDRLSMLGETDPESVAVLERELAAWVAARSDARTASARHRETVANILAAADDRTRRRLLGKLKSGDVELAEQILPMASARAAAEKPVASIGDLRRRLSPLQQRVAAAPPVSSAPKPQAPALPRIEFDHLIHLDNATLTALLRSVDSNVLAIALAGSRDEFIDRVCAQMPKATARVFRKELRKLGPTRLSDVEAAQRAVADAAAMHLVHRRATLAAAQA